MDMMEVRVEPFNILSLGDMGPSLQQVANRIITAAVTCDTPASTSVTTEQPSVTTQRPSVTSVLHAKLTENNLHMKISREHMVQSQPMDLKIPCQTTPPKLNCNADHSPKEASVRETRPIDPDDLQKNFLPLDLTPPKAASMDSNETKTIGPPRYMCRHCAQQFESPTEMRSHIENHLKGKAPHSCSVCGKEYRTPSKLQRHVRVHSGERPYSCEVCARRFTRSDHVKQHMKVHLPQKEMNACRICGQKFMRRSALHLHLQQNHMIGSVFTCHHCGEAFESLELMHAHKLTHDSVLNRMEGIIKSENLSEGLAKFSTSPFKLESQATSSVLLNFENVKIKPKPTNGFTSEQIMSNPNLAQLNYIPVNEENVTQVSDKLITENMAMLAAQEVAKSLDLQNQYNEEIKRLELEAKQHFEKQIEEEHKRQMKEQAKIAACFTLKAAADGLGSMNVGTTDQNTRLEGSEGGQKEGEMESIETSATLASEDGTSMFIIPSTEKDDAGEIIGDSHPEFVDNTDQSIVTTETDQDDYVEMEIDDATDKQTADTEHKTMQENSRETSEAPISTVRKPHKMGPKCKTQAYNDRQESEGDVKRTVLAGTDQASKRMISLINPKLNELIRAKVEQNYLHQTAQSSSLNQNLTANSNYTVENTQNSPNTSQTNQRSNLNFLALSSHLQTGTTEQPHGRILNEMNTAHYSSSIAAALATASRLPANVQTTLPALKAPTRKMLRCEHCLMWFEDNAMWLLHNTLHSADESDPFTCRKCYKKLGNRLEFMAHLVWHLEPNMDI